jgi:glyoxylase I family protein
VLVSGVHHVSLMVDDVPAARSFYVDVLGQRERAARPAVAVGGAGLDAGGQQVHLVEGPVPDDRGQHVALHVADLDGAVAELRDRGIKVSDPSPVGTSRQSFLRDPCGNRVELHEPG